MFVSDYLPMFLLQHYTHNVRTKTLLCTLLFCLAWLVDVVKPRQFCFACMLQFIICLSSTPVYIYVWDLHSFNVRRSFVVQKIRLVLPAHTTRNATKKFLQLNFCILVQKFCRLLCLFLITNFIPEQ